MRGEKHSPGAAWGLILWRSSRGAQGVLGQDSSLELWLEETWLLFSVGEGFKFLLGIALGLLLYLFDHGSNKRLFAGAAVTQKHALLPRMGGWVQTTKSPALSSRSSPAAVCWQLCHPSAPEVFPNPLSHQRHKKSSEEPNPLASRCVPVPPWVPARKQVHMGFPQPQPSSSSADTLHC